MNNENVLDKATQRTALVVANACDLAAAIIRRVAGGDVSNSLNGSTLTKQALANMVQREIVQTLSANKAKQVN